MEESVLLLLHLLLLHLSLLCVFGQAGGLFPFTISSILSEKGNEKRRLQILQLEQSDDHSMSGGVGPAPPSLALASPFASLLAWSGRWIVPIHHQFDPVREGKRKTTASNTSTRAVRRSLDEWRSRSCSSFTCSCFTFRFFACLARPVACSHSPSVRSCQRRETKNDGFKYFNSSSQTITR